MAPLNGHAPPLPVAFQEPLLRFNLTGLCVAPPTTLSIRKNGDRSVMGLTVCCMRLALAIAAHVPCVPNVKKAFLPPNHDGSVPFSGPSLPLQRFCHRSHLPQRALNWPRISLSFGGIGHGVNCDADG
jgi:hypothetical protein